MAVVDAINGHLATVGHFVENMIRKADRTRLMATMELDVRYLMSP